VKYEELVSNPEMMVFGICDFLGLGYSREMIQVYDNPKDRMTNGLYAESKMLGDVKFFTHSSINTGPVEKWKEKYKTEFLGDAAAQLAKSFGYLKGEIAQDYSKLETAPKAEYYDLSHTQKRLWILSQFEKNLTIYNIPKEYLVEGELDFSVVEKSYETVVRRHESLRTTFVMRQGEPKQKIHDFESIGFKLEYIDLRNREDGQRQAEKLAFAEATTVFDLEQGPLFRIKLVHIEQKKYMLLFTLHHIISDGWSMGLLVNELLAIYEAYKNKKENPLSPLRFQYKDFSEWQNRLIQSGRMNEQKEYWLSRFKRGDIPTLNMSLDYPRPPVRDFNKGDFINFNLDKSLCKKISDIEKQTMTTLIMVLLAAYNILLFKYTRQEDIVVGTLLAGRHHPDLEHVIGFFINTLPIRNYPQKDKTFREFLKEIKENMLRAYENQDYSFDSLVIDLGLQGDPSRNPLFDVVFTLNPFFKGGKREEMKKFDFQVEPWGHEIKFAKFDLYCLVTELNETIDILLRYSTQLFKPSTIERMKKHYIEILEQVVDNISIRLNDIKLSHDLLTVKPTVYKDDGSDFKI